MGCDLVSEVCPLIPMSVRQEMTTAIAIEVCTTLSPCTNRQDAEALLE